MPTPLQLVLYVGIPYTCLILFVLGLVYRYTADGIAWNWTARASGLFDDRSMGVAAVTFHGGLFVVLAGHLLGTFGTWFGVSDPIEQFAWVGTIGGFVALFGSSLALYRRIVSKRLRAMSGLQDYLIDALLISIFVTGLYEETVGAYGLVRTGGKWFADLFILQPNVALIAHDPIALKIHLLLSMVFWAVFPISKLGHVLSMPIGYLFRPYITTRRYDSHTDGSPEP